MIKIIDVNGNLKVSIKSPVWGSVTGGSQGDLPYFSTSGSAALLAKNTTASRYLSNTGLNNDPAWAQVNLTNGVTGVLPIANGGTGVAIIPKFSAYPSANAAIVSGVITKVTGDVESFDIGGYYDNAVNYRWTPLIAGIYNVSAGCSFLNAIGAYTISLYLYKNGALIRISESGLTYIAANFSLSISDLISMNGTTDYLEVFVLQNSGVNKTLYAGPERTFFSGTLIP